MFAGFIITLTDSDGSSREHKLAPGSHVIGREPDCEIVAPIFDERNAGVKKMIAQVIANFHAGETGLNRLTGQGRDKQTLTPEYKVVAVRIEKNGGATAYA